MSLILNEWIQKLADARSKAEMADVLSAMPAWTMIIYRDAIMKRLNIRGFGAAVTYVEITRRFVMEPRPFDPSLVLEEAAAWDAIEAALADERLEAAQVAEAAGQALELALSMPE